MAHALESPLAPLLRDFAALAARGEPFALATVVATEGSTYRKPGSQILITSADGPLIFRLMGPERHTFTVTRRAAGSDDEPKAEAASASLPAETAEAAVGTDAP
jgi:hypothetical protein